MVKIDLIYPKLDKDYNGLISGYSIFPPPSGLEIIASYIQEKISGSRIKIWDYSLFDKPSINDLSGEVIGISDWFSNHNNSIKIAQEIKEKNKNCKIVFGGPNASNLNRRILNNHSYIDYVVEGDGEEALLGIINLLNGKESSSNVPNLWYRNSLGETLFTYHKNVNLNSLPRWNFKHLVKSNLEEYDSRKKDYNEDLDRTPIPLSSIRGCLKASKLGKCSYCNIPLRGVRTIKPEKFWNQIRMIVLYS
ncbi:MAG: cobalamin-dependent protein [Candidatus Pacearchaeota archaeon]|nr:cobalamin-dependent protein [Candidatus Pacearchaeota archaeon]